MGVLRARLCAAPLLHRLGSLHLFLAAAEGQCTFANPHTVCGALRLLALVLYSWAKWLKLLGQPKPQGQFTEYLQQHWVPPVEVVLMTILCVSL